MVNQYLCTFFTQILTTALLESVDGRELLENISWSISTKGCCRTEWGSNPQPDHQSDAHLTEPASKAGIRHFFFQLKNIDIFLISPRIHKSHNVQKNIIPSDVCPTKIHITKTCLYNSDPFKPHFYIVKLGFTGVYIIFLIFARKHRLWVLVRTASARQF